MRTDQRQSTRGQKGIERHSGNEEDPEKKGMSLSRGFLPHFLLQFPDCLLLSFFNNKKRRGKGRTRENE